jgi:Transposase and inactivated derivatives
VDAVYVGDLSDVLEAHWSSTVNEKTHAFWSHGQLVERITLTLGDVGVSVNKVSEDDSSSECPDCDSTNGQRDSDEFRCHECGLEAHSDVVGAWNLLQEKTGPMARPAALRAERRRDASQSSNGRGAYWEWNENDRTLNGFEEQSRSLDQTRVSEPAGSQLG